MAKRNTSSPAAADAAEATTKAEEATKAEDTAKQPDEPGKVEDTAKQPDEADEPGKVEDTAKQPDGSDESRKDPVKVEEKVEPVADPLAITPPEEARSESEAELPLEVRAMVGAPILGGLIAQGETPARALLLVNGIVDSFIAEIEKSTGKKFSGGYS